MTKEVLIHLKGMQTTDDPHGSDDPLELITVGEYYYRNNTHYLLYEEQMEGLDAVSYTHLTLPTNSLV